MARNVKLRSDDLHELLVLTDTLQTESGKRLREWIEGELMRREKSGRLGGRTKRDGRASHTPAVENNFDFGA